MTTVAAYMTDGPHTIGADEPLRAAWRLMNELKVRHLPVLQGGQLVGVLSAREVEALGPLPGSSLLTVEEAMVPEAYVTPSDTPLEVVAAEMASRRVGSAIVVSDAGEAPRVVGVFTAVDALRALADALKPPLATAA